MKKLKENQVEKLTNIILGLYHSSRLKMLRHILHSYYPADLVLVFKGISAQETLNILRTADQAVQVKIFQYFSIEDSLEMIPLLRNFEIKYYFENLPSDDKSLLLREMNEKTKEMVLRLISEKERSIVTEILSYDEDSAGSIVTQAATIKQSWSIAEALIHIRQHAEKLEDIHIIYVLDEEEKLVGTVPLESIIFREPQETIENIMSSDVIFIYGYQPQEDAVESIQKYDIVSLAVVDENQKMLGIITYDDAMDLLIEQGTEGMHRFAGVSEGVDEGYLQQSVFHQVKRRFTWTIVPILMEVVTGNLIGKAESMLQSIFILATFIPMIAAAGGNIGSQSASLITRAIALKEIVLKDFFKVMLREFSVATLIAIICCSILIIKMLIFPHPHVEVPMHLIILTVSLALACQLIVSSVLGGIVPLIALKLKIDPAIMSSPVLASSVDILGLLMYFGLVELILL